MYDDDDFYLDDADLADDTELSVVDDAKLKLLNKIENIVTELKDSVKFQETGEYNKKSETLERHISLLKELSYIEDPETDTIDNDKLKEILDSIDLDTGNYDILNLDTYATDDEYVEEDEEWNNKSGADLLSLYQQRKNKNNNNNINNNNNNINNNFSSPKSLNDILSNIKDEDEDEDF